jgi:hypothetical protein
VVFSAAKRPSPLICIDRAMRAKEASELKTLANCSLNLRLAVANLPIVKHPIAVDAH